MKEIWTSLASLMGVLAFCQSLLTAIFPPNLRYTLSKFCARISTYISTYCYFDITEIDGVNTNELYNAVQLYLSTTAATAINGGSRLSLSRSVNSSAVTFALAQNDTLFDSFNGVSVQWEHIVTHRPPQTFSWRPMPDEKRGFTLRVKKCMKAFVIPKYLDHIMHKAGDIRRQCEDRFLYTNTRGGSLDSARPGHPWEAVPFKHPSTFDTLAMDSEAKAAIMTDLKEFASGEDFYRATGRAWKRGYLLYGPPGTGKSSMIAAMANFLNYDIYDLEVTEVGSNSELRKLLMKTTPKSIIVIEDIDCASIINLADRRRGNRTENGFGPGLVQYEGVGPGQEEGKQSGQLTLSGLLNFTDGLWSCCGNERIFVFTTNHVDKLDPALLRSGRMDMHIHMSYCTSQGLRILMKNYVGLHEDFDEDLGVEMMKELERVVDKAKITPADMSELLIRHRRQGKKAVAKALLEELRRRAAEEEKCNGRGPDVVDEEEEEEEKRELLEMKHNHGNGVMLDYEKKAKKEGNNMVVEFCSKENLDDSKYD